MAPQRETHMRYDFLDWLRVIAIFVLLFFHTGMLFVGWGWHITNAEVIPGLELPMDLAHRLRMPLLFLIAGAGMWFALKRRSGPVLVRERSLRLLLPAVVGMFLVVPPQIFVERLVSGEWSGGYLEFITQRVLQFRPYPAGDFSWHHLWFIVYLYVYVLLLLPLMLWWRRAQPELRPGAWLFLLSLPLAINEALLKPLYPETHALLDDWYTFNHYLLLTLYGFVFASMRGVWEWLATHRRVALGLAAAVTVFGVGALELGIAPRDTPVDAFIANVFTWSWLLVFLGFGRHYLSFSNRLLTWAREASYPVYIFHQTVIILIAYFVIRQPWSPGVKYWVVLVGTLATSIALYELARRFAVTRLMFGMKSASAPHQIAVGQTRTTRPVEQMRSDAPII
jgi:surface polysaccharide O-acyltransferase-like enzyme